MIAQYGTLVNTGYNDNDPGFLVLNSVDVVNTVIGTITASYIEKISFNFAQSPKSSTPGIWLYIMNRTNGTSFFIPNLIYRIPYSMIKTNSTGIQTMIFPFNVLPISQGQYLGVGFESTGGSCYRLYYRFQYFITLSNFSNVSLRSYSSIPGGGFACSFVVRTIGSN